MRKKALVLPLLASVVLHVPAWGTSALPVLQELKTVSWKNFPSHDIAKYYDQDALRYDLFRLNEEFLTALRTSDSKKTLSLYYKDWRETQNKLVILLHKIRLLLDLNEIQIQRNAQSTTVPWLKDAMAINQKEKTACLKRAEEAWSKIAGSPGSSVTWKLVSMADITNFALGNADRSQVIACDGTGGGGGGESGSNSGNGQAANGKGNEKNGDDGSDLPGGWQQALADQKKLVSQKPDSFASPSQEYQFKASKMVLSRDDLSDTQKMRMLLPLFEPQKSAKIDEEFAPLSMSILTQPEANSQQKPFRPEQNAAYKKRMDQMLSDFRKKLNQSAPQLGSNMDSPLAPSHSATGERMQDAGNTQDGNPAEYLKNRDRMSLKSDLIDRISSAASGSARHQMMRFMKMDRGDIGIANRILHGDGSTALVNGATASGSERTLFDEMRNSKDMHLSKRMGFSKTVREDLLLDIEKLKVDLVAIAMILADPELSRDFSRTIAGIVGRLPESSRPAQSGSARSLLPYDIDDPITTFKREMLRALSEIGSLDPAALSATVKNMQSIVIADQIPQLKDLVEDYKHRSPEKMAGVDARLSSLTYEQLRYFDLEYAKRSELAIQLSPAAQTYLIVKEIGKIKTMNAGLLQQAVLDADAKNGVLQKELTHYLAIFRTNDRWNGNEGAEIDFSAPAYPLHRRFLGEIPGGSSYLSTLSARRFRDPEAEYDLSPYYQKPLSQISTDYPHGDHSCGSQSLVNAMQAAYKLKTGENIELSPYYTHRIEKLPVYGITSLSQQIGPADVQSFLDQSKGKLPLDEGTHLFPDMIRVFFGINPIPLRDRYAEIREIRPDDVPVKDGVKVTSVHGMIDPAKQTMEIDAGFLSYLFGKKLMVAAYVDSAENIEIEDYLYYVNGTQGEAHVYNVVGISKPILNAHTLRLEKHVKVIDSLFDPEHPVVFQIPMSNFQEHFRGLMAIDGVERVKAAQ